MADMSERCTSQQLLANLVVPSSSPPSLPPIDVLRHVVDVHCHPTDSDITTQAMDDLAITICAMSSRPADQPLVRDLAKAYPEKVIPCFGYHPWFSHWISIEPAVTKEEHYRQLFSPSGERDEEMFERLLLRLPDPIPLADILAELRGNLLSFPHAMLGEVGLDRAARVPIEYTAEPRELTQFITPFEHQLAILESQIDLAVEYRRNISMHSVKSPQATQGLLCRMQQKHGSEWQRINIDLHSCGLSVETWRAIEKRHSNVYISLSTAINGRSQNHRLLIKACSPSRILVESDYHLVERCTERTWDMVLTVAQVKGWFIETAWIEDLEENDWGVVKRLKHNWQEFQKGNPTTTRCPDTSHIITSVDINYRKE